MKRIVSLLLIVVMVCGLNMTSFATNDYTQGTQVQYVGQGAESYTITVPAELKPGQSGTVTLSGTWATNRNVTVTADETVTLTNSINENDQKVLDVTFIGISEVGSNTGTQTFTETVSVAAIQNALFGTWSGKFYYNVELQTIEPLGPGLYVKGSNFTELIAPWEELVENGGIFVDEAEGMITAAPGVFLALQNDEIEMPDEKYWIGDWWYPEGIEVVAHMSYEAFTSGNMEIPEKPETIRVPSTATVLIAFYVDIDFMGSVEGYMNTANFSPSSTSKEGIPNFYINGKLIGDLIIPEGTTTIPAHAFVTHYSITSIHFPKSLTKIGWGAFNECWNVKEVTYAGTSEEWANVEIVNSTDYDWWDDFKTTVVYCEGDDTYVNILH